MGVFKKSVYGTLILLEIFLMKGLFDFSYDIASRSAVVQTCPLVSKRDGIMNLYRKVVRKVDVDGLPGSLNSEEWGNIYSTIGKDAPKDGRFGHDLGISDLEKYLELCRKD